MKTTLLSVLIIFNALVSFGQWSYTDLLIPRKYMGSAAIGNEVYFAGGSNDDGFWEIVEVYDLSTCVWDVAGNLSVARHIIGGTTTCGSKIFFSGGFDENVSYNAVDIYNTVTQTWSVEFLSVDRFSHAALSHGDTVMFAGGVKIQGSPVFLNSVEIFNVENGAWMTVDYLSQPRMGIAATVVADQAIFAGGMTNTSGTTTDRVDIYNFTSKTWSVEILSLARAYASAVTVGYKVIIAGGVTDLDNPTDRVDIYDASTGTWDIATLSLARSAIDNGAAVAGKAYFAGGGNFSGGNFYSPSDVIDVYDADSNTWSVMNLQEPRVEHSVLGVGDYMVVAGGKNEQENIVSTVEIFYDPQTGITTQPEEDISITIYPNPCNNNLTINTPNIVFIDEVKIYDQTGQKVQQGKPVNNTLDISRLEKGMYIIELKTNQGKIREKLIVQ
jgi:N-acetylneuraminic acid mutarotase